MLISFPHTPPPLRLGNLESYLTEVHATFPVLLRAGDVTLSHFNEVVQPLAERVILAVGEGLDWRLATQYAVLLAFTEKVLFIISPMT